MERDIYGRLASPPLPEAYSEEGFLESASESPDEAYWSPSRLEPPDDFDESYSEREVLGRFA